MTSIISVSHLHFTYPQSAAAIDDLSFAVSAGRKAALVGANGSGKTTLLRLLAGLLSPESGTLDVTTSRVLVAQDITAIESGRSGGETRLAALRAAFAESPALLLLDEPTNDLDADAKAYVLRTLANFAGTVFMVSHDPNVLDAVDDIFELRRGRLQRHPPGYATFAERLRAEEAALARRIQNLESEQRQRESGARTAIARQKKRAARGQKAGVASNLPKIIVGAKKRQAQITLARLQDVHESRVEASTEELRLARERLRQISLFEWKAAATRPPAGQRLVRVNDFALPNFRRALSFELSGARRVHLRGKNGSGKSTLLRALDERADVRGRHTGQAYATAPRLLLDQRLAQFTGNEGLWEWFHARVAKTIPESRQILGRLGFEQREQERPVAGLSGGEKMRLELAIPLHRAEPPQLLLLDEPTNHLDPESRMILTKFLGQYAGALIVVSHDARFVAELQFETTIDLDDYQ